MRHIKGPRSNRTGFRPTTGMEIAPFVAPEERTLAANRLGDIEKRPDRTLGVTHPSRPIACRNASRFSAA